jgi:site-specific DNA-methyltransferase (adenine-specific)
MELVDKGEWDKARDLSYIHEFNKQWLNLCKAKLKKDGTIFISGTMHNIYSIGFALQELEYKIINDIAWFKVNPPPNLSCRFFTHSTETILWAKKSTKSKHTFNYNISREINYENVGKQMLSLWKITPPKKDEKKFGKHPTQKPLALMDRIIKTTSNENDLILDPFCGSGTTAISCLKNKRKFVGFELEKEYVDLAIKRLNDC